MGAIEKEIDMLGRVVIPKKFRNALGVEPGSRVLLSIENDALVISAKSNHCALCGKKISSEEKFRLCVSCLGKIKSAE